jgi:hypothetical protein
VLRAQGQDDAKRRSQRSRRMREVVFRVLVERPGHLEAQAETLPIHRPVSTHENDAERQVETPEPGQQLIEGAEWRA